jgi:hypothetical protein
MKKIVFLFPFLLFAGSFYYKPDYSPILMERTALDTSVQYVPNAMSILDPGNICVFKNWILLVEHYKGVHVIDNTDPFNPIRVGFLRVPGCQSVAVGNGVLYVDNAVDLVGVRFHPESGAVEEIARSRKALPELIPPEGSIPYEFRRHNRPKNTEIVGWISNNDAL